MYSVQELGKRAKACVAHTALLSTKQKNQALFAIASALEANKNAIEQANHLDIAAAQENGMTPAMIDRLRLTPERIQEIAEAVRYVAGLADPVGSILGGGTRPNGLQITRISVPMGVVGVIYESRPNVTVDTAALCLKSGNACMLRGGKEAIHSNTALVAIMRGTLEEQGLEPDSILLVEDTTRQSATDMMQAVGLIDLLIPRGGKGLIQSVVQNARVPVIETGLGNCHIFVDASADVAMALDIVDNAKTSRPSVCNAVETVLVHHRIAPDFLPLLQARLAKNKVELRGCPQTLAILGTGVVPAQESDFAEEFDDYILAIKVVADVEEAMQHIARYSTHHSEAIVTSSYENSRRFTQLVDSAAVYVNASTRFTDGGEFGLGAEIGISTQRLHARGPMGLEHLTTYKYVVQGNGQVR